MQSEIPEMNPYEIPFFYDFMLFLKRLQKQPIKRTLTGQISLTDIKEIIPQFKQQERIKEYKSFGWRLHKESELDFLEQIKIISEMMFIIYKRKGLLLLSKNGEGFFEKLSPLNQYTEMVLHFWYKVNWGYFSHGKEVSGRNLAEFLQYHQTEIWQVLLKTGIMWIDYTKFCHWLCDYFNLRPYIYSEFDFEHELLFEINRVLFMRNLVRFGCVEIIEESYEHAWHKEITKFRLTPMGLHVLHKAVFENYL